jgi:hypothetical protein
MAAPGKICAATAGPAKFEYSNRRERVPGPKIAAENLHSIPVEPILECGGLPPLSPKLDAWQQNALGEACLACLNHRVGPPHAVESVFEFVAAGSASSNRASSCRWFGVYESRHSAIHPENRQRRFEGQRRSRIAGYPPLTCSRHPNDFAISLQRFVSRRCNAILRNAGFVSASRTSRGTLTSRHPCRRNVAGLSAARE